MGQGSSGPMATISVIKSEQDWQLGGWERGGVRADKRERKQSFIGVGESALGNVAGLGADARNLDRPVRGPAYSPPRPQAGAG